MVEGHQEIPTWAAVPGRSPLPAHPSQPSVASSALTQGPFSLHLLLPRADGFFHLSQKQEGEGPAPPKMLCTGFLSHLPLLQSLAMDSNAFSRAIFKNQGLYNEAVSFEVSLSNVSAHCGPRYMGSALV